jgi:hypothetical protein
VYRWAHTVEEQRILALLRRNIVLMIPRVYLYPIHSARVELFKERLEPVLLLVVDGNGFPRPMFLAVSACRVTHGIVLLILLTIKKGRLFRAALDSFWV